VGQCIGAKLVDKSEGVRGQARLCFFVFARKWPMRAAALQHTMDPGTRSRIVEAHTYQSRESTASSCGNVNGSLLNTITPSEHSKTDNGLPPAVPATGKGNGEPVVLPAAKSLGEHQRPASLAQRPSTVEPAESNVTGPPQTLGYPPTAAGGTNDRRRAARLGAPKRVVLPKRDRPLLPTSAEAEQAHCARSRASVAAQQVVPVSGVARTMPRVPVKASDCPVLTPSRPIKSILKTRSAQPAGQESQKSSRAAELAHSSADGFRRDSSVTLSSRDGPIMQQRRNSLGPSRRRSLGLAEMATISDSARGIDAPREQKEPKDDDARRQLMIVNEVTPRRRSVGQLDGKSAPVILVPSLRPRRRNSRAAGGRVKKPEAKRNMRALATVLEASKSPDWQTRAECVAWLRTAFCGELPGELLVHAEKVANVLTELVLDPHRKVCLELAKRFRFTEAHMFECLLGCAGSRGNPFGSVAVPAVPAGGLPCST